MHPKYFGESHDMAKRNIMEWLAPNEQWIAHPMLFNERPEPPLDRAFLQQYRVALGVEIVDNESEYKNLLDASKKCEEHLLLDPDTGLLKPRNNRRSKKHVMVDQFIEIVKSPYRPGKLTLIYDQSYSRGNGDIWKQTAVKLRDLRDSCVHAVAYMAHAGSSVRFIWASPNSESITEATQRMQAISEFPSWRFIDDGCGHVKQ